MCLLVSSFSLCVQHDIIMLWGFLLRRMCVCVCMWARARACVSVCVSVCLAVCVCLCARARANKSHNVLPISHVTPVYDTVQCTFWLLVWLFLYITHRSLLCIYPPLIILLSKQASHSEYSVLLINTARKEDQRAQVHFTTRQRRNVSTSRKSFSRRRGN